MPLLDYLKRRLPGRRRHEPPRDTTPFPNFMQGPATTQKRLVHKPTPRNLRYFASTPYARRAINAIKNPIAMYGWEIRPLKGVEMNSELEKQIELATLCFNQPNSDDNFRSLLEAVTEDILLGAGAIEHQVSGDPIRPLWMWPVDGLSIQIYPGWTGNPGEARYVQMIAGTYAGGGQQIPLRNDELIYLRPNPTSASPFGLGPLEVAFQSISRILGVGDFAGNVASNSRPSIGLDLGEGAGPEAISAFRNFWTHEVEGQGKMPILGMAKTSDDGKTRGPSILRFYPEGDDGLYLKYQEFLKMEIATAFDLSPQNLGVERDVNRSTAEVAEDRDRANAIKPMANLIASHLTREALHGRLGFSQIEFAFVGVDPQDELSLAEVYEREYRSNAITPNEYRARRGLPPLEGQWGDLVSADVEVALNAARGAAQVDDPELTKGKPSQPGSKSKED